jgi:hypothetical protein
MDTPAISTTPIVEEKLPFWQEHRFLVLIIATLVIAIILVSVSIFIYKVSGSAQLDLSRPGYQSVSNKVDRTDTVTDYSAFGPVNKDTVKAFTTTYDQQATKAKAVDAFNGNPLNPDVLEFSDPTTSN